MTMMLKKAKDKHPSSGAQNVIVLNRGLHAPVDEDEQYWLTNDSAVNAGMGRFASCNTSVRLILLHKRHRESIHHTW